MRTSLLIPLVGALVLVAAVALAGGGGGRDTPFDRVAADPVRFDGEPLRVTGRVVARASSSSAVEGVFVLEGPDGGRLLVLPRDGIDLTSVVVGVRLAVRAEVATLPPSADEAAGDRPGDAVTVTDLARRHHADALLRATEIAARAG